jgi:lipopolysaccharide export system permease protein
LDLPERKMALNILKKIKDFIVSIIDYFQTRNLSPLESRRFISKTIYVYILNEMLFSFVICFCFFFFIFFVNQILLMVKQILTKHVPFNQVMLLMLFSLPTVIAMSAPFACLVGTLMTVGRLTSDNEILVMLSSGLSYKNVFFPAITVGILISLLSFFTNDVLLPAGTVQFNKLWRKILVSTPALEMEANSVKKFKNTVIVTGGVKDNIIENLLIMDRTENGERRIILASSAELKDGGKEGLSLNLDSAFVHSSKEIAREDYDYANTESLQYWVSNENIIQQVISISPREMSSRDVHTVIKDKKADLALKLNDRKIKMINNASGLENILRAGPSGEGWNRRTTTVATFEKDIESLNFLMKDRSLLVHIIEIYRKFSVPLGAFCFVFLAVSLGLMAKKSGQTVGFIFGNIIAVIYWSMLFIGQAMGLRIGLSPFVSMWSPNIFFLTIGIVLAVIKVRK